MKSLPGARNASRSAQPAQPARCQLRGDPDRFRHCTCTLFLTIHSIIGARVGENSAVAGHRCGAPMSLSPMPWRSRRIRRESAKPPAGTRRGRMASGGEEGRQLGHDLVVFDVDLEGFQDPAYQHVEADDGDDLDQLARR